ncbi:CTP synthase [Candidatus Woesearchaeota archaeon]|nr:CTP synthase [Candidatus Woesearchaeota archaeon]
MQQEQKSGKELLDQVAAVSDEHEFYTPIVKGYEKGKTKYVFVFGTVMSGLGKGIFSSSLAKLMQDKGFKVEPIKMEGYLNLDSGTLNPFRHGEVFVLDDGTETDMDLGTYERFLNKNLSKDNFMTTGQIYTAVLEKERKGEYLGRDVQIIPHVTAEIKQRLRTLAVKKAADVIFVEVGGTVGDLENSHYMEAIREIIYEEGKENICFVTLTYIINSGILGEQKSKAAQLGIKKLMELGIQPDVIACRSEHPVTEKVREKISIYSNVPMERVISMHDVKSIYQLPQLLRDAKIDEYVVAQLKIEKRVNKESMQKNKEQWKAMLAKLNTTKEVTIGITGKYTLIRDAYASVIHALQHAGMHHGVDVKIKWIETTAIEEGKTTVERELGDVDGIVVPGGFGKRGVEGKIMCLKYVREKNIPYLGLCYGFQMAVIEFARNVCNLRDAHTSEVNPKTPHLVIDILPEQKKIEGLGGNMRLGGRNVEIKSGTKAWELYSKKETARERFRHRYEVNPEYIPQLEKHGLVFSGKAPNHPIMQILELPSHKFFMGSQFHPEFTSRPLAPNPMYLGFMAACVKK